MDLTYFPQFMRANYPAVANESNEDLIEIGTQFKKYLEEKFTGKLEKLEKIWNISPKTVLHNRMHNFVFTTNGYEPALIIHFGNYVSMQTDRIRKGLEEE